MSCSEWLGSAHPVSGRVHGAKVNVELTFIGNDTVQTYKWTYIIEALTCHVEFTTLWIAAGMMLLSLCVVTSLLYGYWQLDRKVSLSPLETGRALATLIMSEPAGEVDMDAEELLRVMGQKRKE
jgi:alkylation response protein AidB-like acyl-CoA dehydrogenase